jgi:hypothetical protein
MLPAEVNVGHVIPPPVGVAQACVPAPVIVHTWPSDPLLESAAGGATKFAGI